MTDNTIRLKVKGNFLDLHKKFKRFGISYNLLQRNDNMTEWDLVLNKDEVSKLSPQLNDELIIATTDIEGIMKNPELMKIIEKMSKVAK